jgi:MYXO-CTERM domain-containing protein
MNKIIAISAAAALAGTASAAITVNGSVESFDNVNDVTISSGLFSDGSGDFLVIDPAQRGSFVEYFGGDGSYLHGMDLDGENATLPVTVDFATIDISGFTDLALSVDLAEDDDGTSQDWDVSDFVSFRASIDGGSFVDILNIENDGSQFNSAPFIDGDFDGTGEGAEITSTFANFAASIAGTGSTLDLRVVLQLDSGDEDIAIDNVAVTGVPTPGAAGLLGVAGLAAARRRRA